jgi:hypothetical protein
VAVQKTDLEILVDLRVLNSYEHEKLFLHTVSLSICLYAHMYVRFAIA